MLSAPHPGRKADCTAHTPPTDFSPGSDQPGRQGLGLKKKKKKKDEGLWFLVDAFAHSQVQPFVLSVDVSSVELT